MILMDSEKSHAFELAIGYDDPVQFKEMAELCISAADFENVFINAKISAPDYKTTEAVLSFVPQGGILRLDESVIFNMVDSMFNTLSTKTKSNLAKALMEAVSALMDKNASSTKIKNAFVRTVCSLYTDFAGLLGNLDMNSCLFFEGRLNKYDFITINVLCRLGVSGMAVCLAGGKPDFLTEPLFKVVGGQFNTDLSLEMPHKNRTLAELDKNQWFSFSTSPDVETCIDALVQSKGNRLQNGYRVLSLYIAGAQSKEKYLSAVNRFFLTAKSGKNPFVIDSSFANPTFDEVQSYSDLNCASKTVEEILNMYAPLSGTAFPSHMGKTVDFLMSQKHFTSVAQKQNYEKIIRIWLIRVCGALYKDINNLEHMPVIIVWGGAKGRVAEFLRCLENMPVDVIQFSPGKEPGFSPETQRTIDLGPAKPEITDFPYELEKLSRHETAAFSAEQEIRGILGEGVTTYYQMKQFSKLHPVVLKTTFEEIDIIWREPAKFRPNFSTAGGIVTIPSIFAKINGVKDSVESYLAGIKAKITPDTLVLDKFPYLHECKDPSALDFMKRVYFKDHLDLEKIKNSQFYNYGLFSAETQNVIIQGIIDFLQNNWYAKKRTNFDYNILECLLRLPHDAVQLVHSFSFTENVPKLLVFNAANTPCSAEDCIFIMFLKSLGFDVAIYVPTGYMVIEGHIREELFNSINIGPYNYDLSGVDIKGKLPKYKKKLFGKLKGNVKNEL